MRVDRPYSEHVVAASIPNTAFFLRLLASLMVFLLMTVGCSEDDVVTPSDGRAPAGVADLAVSSATDSSATLTWSAPGDDGTEGTATEYDIRYSTVVITEANFGSATPSSGPPAPSAPGVGETFTATGLTEETAYYFALRAADEAANWSALSNIVSATTRSTAPPQFVLMWGSMGTGDGQFEFPLGVAVNAGGDVYVADLVNQRIQKFDSTGTFLGKWSTAAFGFPEFIAVDGSGNVYATADTIVMKYDGDGAFLAAWGSRGTGDGQFDFARGIAVDRSGNVYVADESNKRVQKFDDTGHFIAKWGTEGTGDGQFDLPVSVAVDGDDNVYVVDRGLDRVQKFDDTGTFRSRWGSSGAGEGQFDFPMGIAVDGAAHVYVADQQNRRVQKFTGSGAFLTQWGSEGSGPGQFYNLVGVAAGRGGNIYVTDFSNRRVQRFKE